MESARACWTFKMASALPSASRMAACLAASQEIFHRRTAMNEIWTFDTYPNPEEFPECVITIDQTTNPPTVITPAMPDPPLTWRQA